MNCIPHLTPTLAPLPLPLPDAMVLHQRPGRLSILFGASSLIFLGTSSPTLAPPSCRSLPSWVGAPLAPVVPFVALVPFVCAVAGPPWSTYHIPPWSTYHIPPWRAGAPMAPAVRRQGSGATHARGARAIDAHTAGQVHLLAVVSGGTLLQDKYSWQKV